MTLLLAEEGEFPDVESLVMDMLAGVEVDGVPVGDNSGTRTPETVERPYWHVFRAINAGGMNPQAWSDTASLYVAAWSDTRERARQMVRGARAVITAYCDGGDHKGVLIDRMWETGAPGVLPTDDEDDRRIELGVGLRLRRHWSAPVTA